MLKLINLIICFILISNYGESKELSLYIDDLEFDKISIDKYHRLKAKRYHQFKNDNLKEQKFDLQSSASSNDELNVLANDNEKQNQRFSNWFDISEHSNQTTVEHQPTIKLESNLSNLNKLISSNNLISKPIKKKKWRLVSSSTLSDTSIDEDKNLNLNLNKQASKKKAKKSKKLKTANLELKFKETNNREDYIKDKIANTTIYTLNKKPPVTSKIDLKFKLNDAIDVRNYESNRLINYSNTLQQQQQPNRFIITPSLNATSNSNLLSSLARSNDTLARRTQLTSASSILSSKKILLASMIPSMMMMKGLKDSHTHVAFLQPTATVAQPQQIAMMPVPQPIAVPIHVPVPVPQIHVVAQPRPIYHHHIAIARPQPTVIAQPIIQQPIYHQQPIVHRKIITQPILIRQPIHMIRTVNVAPPQPQTIYLPADQNCNNQQQFTDDSNEEATIGDPVDDEDTSLPQQDDSDSYSSKDSWGNHQAQDQQQVRIVPQQIITQQQPIASSQDSWGNSNSKNNVQNQKIYAYHTASVPKSTRTVYTQTKMIPSITSVHSTTSYTPEHRHTVVETDHNAKPIVNLVSTSQRRIVSKPVYTVKAIHQPVSIQTVSPTYQVSSGSGNSQGSW